MYPLDDTIAAIASPPGGAARGILRLSGPEAIACVAQFLSRGQRAAALRRGGSQRDCRLARTAGPSLAAAVRGVRLDWGEGRGERGEARKPFPASNPQSLIPNPFPSYTGQPVVEIHTIGSPPLLELALRSFCGAGARLAGPGEFTLRAFLSGRIDLGQAEAVLGVIDAVDRRDLEIALAQLAGGLAHPVQRLHDALLELLAELEAGFDFPDESAAFVTPEQLGRAVRRRPAANRRPLGTNGRPRRSRVRAARDSGRPAKRRQEQPLQRPSRRPGGAGLRAGRHHARLSHGRARPGWHQVPIDRHGRRAGSGRPP